MSDHAPPRRIAVLDLPPRRAHRETRASFEAAAARWDAEVLWIDRPLAACHPWWQKLMVCRHVAGRHGPGRVLQLDNDMLVRDDCPSPFDRVGPGRFGLVACRQGYFPRLGPRTWPHRVHRVWGERTGTAPAPAWAHPNGGLYLYDTDASGPTFEGILASGPRYGYDPRFGCDETLIINRLWQDHRDRIVFLPPAFNTLLHHNRHLGGRGAMASYVYHFVGGQKRYLPGTAWRRAGTAPAGTAGELCRLLERSDGPPRRGLVLGVFYGALVGTLLARFPDLEVFGVDRWAGPPGRPRDSPSLPRRIAATGTLPWGLAIAATELAANTSRFHPLAVGEGRAARCFDEGELDFVLLDGEAWSEPAPPDLAAWWPKVRPGGLLLGRGARPAAASPGPGEATELSVDGPTGDRVWARRKAGVRPGTAGRAPVA